MKQITLLLLFLALTVVSLSISPNPIQAQSDIQEGVYQATITNVLETQENTYDAGQTLVDQLVEVLFTTGPLKGTSQEIRINQIIGVDEKQYTQGDQVLINHSRDPSGFEAFYVIDYVRTTAIARYLILFIALVIYVGRWKGLRSLFGLAASFLVIFYVLLPGIQAGYDPILVTLGSALIIMLSTFYLTHGFNKKTTIALLGTGITLILAGILSRLMVADFNLTGYASEEANFLQFIKQGSLNIQGLLMAGIIISVVGILDDITISQTSVVTELIRANPKLSPRQIYSQAMQVGQDHIGSLVNTLILVYVGAALPLTLLFMLDETRSFSTVISYGIVAEEIARTLVGSIALVLAVPITTILATRFINKNNVKQIASELHQH